MSLLKANKDTWADCHHIKLFVFNRSVGFVSLILAGRPNVLEFVGQFFL